jgi:hypothetical protein
MTQAMAEAVPRADGSVRPETRMDVEDLGAVLYLAAPLDANIATMTLMTTAMPFLATADLRLEPGSSRAAGGLKVTSSNCRGEL